MPLDNADGVAKIRGDLLDTPALTTRNRPLCRGTYDSGSP